MLLRSKFKTVNFLGVLTNVSWAVVLIALGLTLNAHASTVNWSQPPAICIEQSFSHYEHEAKDGEELVADMKAEKSATKRTQIKASGDYDDALVAIDSVRRYDKKVDDIYKAAASVDMPPQILLGTIRQESSMSDDGVSEDGGNYSCGISQLDVGEFCQYATSLSRLRALEIKWPYDEVNAYIKATPDDDFCTSDLLDSNNTKPMWTAAYEEHKSKYTQSHWMPAQLAGDVKFKVVASELPGVSQTQKDIQYKVIRSFLLNCGHHNIAIPALAKALRENYDQFVPDEMKKEERYAPGQRFEKSCEKRVDTSAYPFNSGWLLAVAIYNAGEQIVPGVAKYKTKDWSEMHASDLVETLKRIPLTGEMYGKTRFDWDVVIGYLSNVVNAQSTEILIGK